MKKILIAIFTFIDYLYPKSSTRVIIGSNNCRGITGNSRVFGEYLEAKGYDVYYNWDNPPKGKSHISHRKVKDWPKFFRAKVVVTTHSISDLGKLQNILKNNRYLVELWHGIPIKAMGQLIENNTRPNWSREKGKFKSVKLWSVTSELFKHLYKAMFPIDPSLFQVLGSPRNDQYKDQVVDLGKYLAGLPEYEKVILYAPTRREGSSSSSFFPFKDRATIIEYIEENKILILLRGHIDDVSSVDLKSDYIRVFNSDIVPDIDTVLSVFDGLITDYSSIYFDYLFFNRPIGFIPYDLKEYLENRGLLFDYHSVTPGEKIYSSDEFIKYLGDIVGNRDGFKERRQMVFDLAYKYQDYNSCDRIYNYLIKEGFLPSIGDN